MFDPQEIARGFAFSWIIEWHRNEQDRQEWKAGLAEHGTPKDALRWYCCYKVAEQNHEQNRIKDWAHMFLEGINPMDDEGEADTFHVWLNDDEDGLVETWAVDLLQDLKNFYGFKEETES